MSSGCMPDMPCSGGMHNNRSGRLTGALLDRLTHRVHILEMNGESYRLKQSRQAAPVRAASDPADA